MSAEAGTQRVGAAARPAASRPAGFSLIELMIAMVVTLVVTGAIYGLLAGGQTAFRREPLLVERQQNIRIAMDMIVRDMEGAGLGMHKQTQVFSVGLDDWNLSRSPLSPMTAAERSNLGLGGTPGSARADSLEVLTYDGDCPPLMVDSLDANNLTIRGGLPSCLPVTASRGQLVYVSGGGGPASKAAGAPQPGVLYAFAGADPARLYPVAGSGGGSSELNPDASDACAGGSDPGAGTCAWAAKMLMVRYQIAPENPERALDALRNPPCLWRSDSGLFHYDGTKGAGPDGPEGDSGANNPWQLVARGIDDLQVQYQTGAEWPGSPTTWLDEPPAIGTVAPFEPRMVHRVRITLSGYAVGTGVGGETQGGIAADPGRRRGQLTTIVVPRATLTALHDANQWR